MKISDLYWHRVTPLHMVLWPLSQLYQLCVLLKRSCYKFGILSAKQLPVPVITIDRITVDDSALLPALSWLIEHLHAHQIHPGIIYQGHREYTVTTPMAVTMDSDMSQVSAEMMLLAKQYSDACTIWVGKNRVQTAQMLLQANTHCQVIICCDGLHDYSYQTDMKLTVMDIANNHFGNGLVLPAGPLRESLSDLADTTACIVHGAQDMADIPERITTHYMYLAYRTAYHLFKPEQEMTLNDFINQPVSAFSSFEHIQSFSDYLSNNGIRTTVYALPNNPALIEERLGQVGENELILMPEIDAMRCQDFSDYPIWALPVKANIDNSLDQAVLALVNKTTKTGESATQQNSPGL